jgi:hypothetical protein
MALLQPTATLPDASESGPLQAGQLPVVVHGAQRGCPTWFVIAVVGTAAGPRCLLVTNLEASESVAATLARVRVPLHAACQ